MKAVLVGYGRMGKEAEAVLSQRGHEVVGIIDPALGSVTESSSLETLGRGEIAIEFSQPAGVEGNARLYARAGIRAVVGTTGWNDKRETVKGIVEKAGIGYLWASNFAIGAHIFLRLVDRMAEFYDSVPLYDILAYELHHNQKGDSPSGTALTMGSHILNHTSRKKSLITDKLDRKIEPTELHIASVRGGSIPGTHTVMLDSAADTIELTHTARNRGGLAMGAVMAAEWLMGKTGFFNVEQFVDELLKNRA